MSKPLESRYYDELIFRTLPDPARARALFAATCERFGSAFEGGCFCTLIRGRRSWEDGIDQYPCCLRNLHFSIFDHSTFFRRRGEPVSAVVGQPYDYDDTILGPSLRGFCALHGLGMEVGEGWHFPGFTTALIFTRLSTTEPRKWSGHYRRNRE